MEVVKDQIRYYYELAYFEDKVLKRIGSKYQDEYDARILNIYNNMYESIAKYINTTKAKKTERKQLYNALDLYKQKYSILELLI